MCRRVQINSANRYLLPADEVPPELWERNRVERRHPDELLRHNGYPADSKVTGKYITRAVLSGWVDGERKKESKSFDINLGPLPTITSWAMSRIHDNRPDSTLSQGMNPVP